MSVQIQNLRDERVRLIKNQKDLMTKAEQDSGGWTSERWAEFERFEDAISKTESQIKALEREESVALNYAKSSGSGNKTDAEVYYREIFPKLLEHGVEERTMSPEERKVYDRLKETRAPIGSGGVLVPDELQANVIARMQNMSGARDAARVIETANGRTFDYPFVDETGTSGEIVSENPSSKTSEDSPTYTEKSIGSFLASSKEMVISRQTLQDSPIDLVPELERVAAMRLFNVLNPLFTTGSGSGEPEGIVTGSNINATTSSAGTLDRVDLIETIYKVARPYRTNGAFMISDSILSEIRKLELGSADSRPLYQPSANAGEPDQLEGFPIVVNNDLDNALTAGNKILTFGDHERFIVRDVAGAEMLEFNEVRGRSYQKSYVMFERHDSKLLDQFAIATLEVS